ncbi:alpha-ketoglutarate-dependent dioxygenase AlkB [Actinokineospora iranica]|nr:alpha-ketoglutarate-dependent dioxygenase AlkB [Actinokineospora iranica]
MTIAFQGSLLDDGDGVGPLTKIERKSLDRGAWVDSLPGWLHGADDLFTRLAERVPWQAERRRMYDSVVEVPRLLSFYGEGAPLPDPLLATARTALEAHYQERLPTAGLCFYRDGRDSVAWHGDNTGRGAREDTLVAIVSVGAPRPLLLRPRGGGETLRFPVGHGDLLVMGGSCQRTWEHAIPKTTRPVGPRISIQFRPRGVR